MLTIEQVARLFHCHPNTVKAHLKKGKFPNAIKEASADERYFRWLIPQSDLDNWRPRNYHKS